MLPSKDDVQLGGAAVDGVRVGCDLCTLHFVVTHIVGLRDAVE